VANEEHVAILKRGVMAWNKWREENLDVQPDLTGANLIRADLSHANLRHAYLSGATLSDTDLKGADLGFTEFGFADLEASNLRGADLGHADLSYANLSQGDLSHANLIRADLRRTNLSRANLEAANLGSANLRDADLSGADLSGAEFGETGVSAVDLSEVVGIEEVRHLYPSSVCTDTLERTAQGLAKNPSRQGAVEIFLRGAGVEEHMIRYFRSMIGKPIEFFSAFISYSHADADKRFAKRLYNDLQMKGIRCWLDEHEILPGDPIMKFIDRSIRIWDKVLLCCSETSLKSWWVKDEIKKAIQKEQKLEEERGKEIYSLVPLNLDGHLFSNEYQPEFESVLKERHAPDFVGWESDNAKYEEQLKRVIQALRADEGARTPAPEPKL
jgi:hypothetical protein